MHFYTIGVYNSSEAAFFNKLTQNNIDTFCDIRQRRGVRGSKYAFVNSRRLQEKLSGIGINYMYLPELAPSTEIRSLQKEKDKKEGIIKRDRDELAQVFKLAYKDKILSLFEFNSFFNRLNEMNARNIVFFCVEERPGACHRSLVSDKIESIGYKVSHL